MQPYPWKLYPRQPLISGGHCAQNTHDKILDPDTPHPRTQYARQPYPCSRYPRKPRIPGDYSSQNRAHKILDHEVHIIEHRMHGNRILGDRILGNCLYLEAIVLRTRPQDSRS